MPEGWTPVAEPSGWTPVEAAPPKAPAPSEPPMTMLGRPLNPILAQQIRDMQTRASKTAASAPAVLGFAGGLAGGIPGAMVGGGVGEALHQSVQRAHGDATAPQTMGAQAKAIGVQGALQGVFEGAGQALMAGATRGSTWLMNRALNPTERLSREFPELSQTMIDNSIAVSKGGYAKARGLLAQAKHVANLAIDEADKAGASIARSSIVDGLNSTLDSIIKASTDKIGDLSKLAGVEKKLVASYGDTLSLKEADALKTELQRSARSYYLAASGPNGKPALRVVSQAYADAATKLNSIIDQAASAAGFDGYRAANSTAQDLIGAVRGLAKAIRPGKNLYQAMVRPGIGAVVGGSAGQHEGHPILGAVAGAVATSPGTMSREALLLAHPAMQVILRQMPRATAEALTGFLQQHLPSLLAASSAPASPTGQ